MKNLVLEKENGIMKVTIKRPEYLNALNTETLMELKEVLDNLKEDEEIKVIIITGEGKAFVSGADLSEMSEKNPEEALEFALLGQEIFDDLESLEKVTIAMINGYALGGGLELALACDIRIASEKAKIGSPEVNFAICPGWGATQRLPRIVGEGKALALILTGEMINADEAERIGLINEVVSEENLEKKTMELARKIAEKSSLGIKMIKKAFNKNKKLGLNYEATLFSICFSTGEPQRRMKDFLKRD
ncbi:MAG: enoyl-CoA hydratase/isomerase family protein [Candidatus Hydrothermarchaeota archaeon]